MKLGQRGVWEPLCCRHVLHWVVKTLGVNMNWAVFQSVGFGLSGEDNTNYKVTQFTCTHISLHPSEAEIRECN